MILFSGGCSSQLRGGSRDRSERSDEKKDLGTFSQFGSSLNQGSADHMAGAGSIPGRDTSFFLVIII